MARRRTEPGLVDALVEYIFDAAQGDSLRLEMVEWLTTSARFRAFAHAHRDKIRKKVRGASDAEASRDVRAELRVAHLLLAEPSIELAFEAQGSQKGGPDFTVEVAGGRPFNLEVTRIRRLGAIGTHGGPLLAKLRQLPPGMPNVLLIADETGEGESFDIEASTRSLRARADAKDEDFFSSRGFGGSREFYQRYLRLGAVVVWREATTDGPNVIYWINRSARIAIPDRPIRACMARLQAVESVTGQSPRPDLGLRTADSPEPCGKPAKTVY